MPDAGYFRSQAELCLRLAAQISDRREADALRVRAAHYEARAVEVETSRPAPDATGMNRPFNN